MNPPPALSEAGRFDPPRHKAPEGLKTLAQTLAARLRGPAYQNSTAPTLRFGAPARCTAPAWPGLRICAPRCSTRRRTGMACALGAVPAVLLRRRPCTRSSRLHCARLIWGAELQDSTPSGRRATRSKLARAQRAAVDVLHQKTKGEPWCVIHQVAQHAALAAPAAARMPLAAQRDS